MSKSHIGSTHSSASHGTSSAGHGSSNYAGSANASGGKGFGVHLETLDTAGKKLDQQSSDLARIGSGIKGVNVGPQSFGVIGQAFAGGAKDHVDHTAQTVDHAAKSVDQASTGVRKTTDLYRRIEDGNHKELSNIHFSHGVGKPVHGAPSGTQSAGAANGGASESGGHPSSPSGSKISDSNGNPRENSTPTAQRPTCGDPIDVSTGRMMLTQKDVELAAMLPLVVSRTHVSAYRLGRWFGPSWASTVDQRVEVDEKGVHFAVEDGTLLSYPVPGAEQPVLPVCGPHWPLIRTQDGGYVVVDPETNRWSYFAGADGGRLPITAVGNGNGHRIDFGYDAEGVLAEIRHSAGYRVAVETTDGLITALRLVDGEELMRYRYDAHRRLTEVVNSSGLPLRFEYDDAGRIVRWEDRNGMWYRYGFDAQGRCVQAEGADGYLSYTFSYGHLETRATDSLGHTTTYEFNEHLQVIRETNPLGNVTVSTWDDGDRLLSRTDPLGRATGFGYDLAGNLTTVTRPDGSQTLVEYNHQRLPVTIVDPDGAIWRREYAPNGSLAAVVDPSGARTTYEYDDLGHLAMVGDTLGNATVIESNDAGLPTTVTDTLGTVTRYTYDAYGRPKTITDALGGITRMSWTAEGQLAARTAADGTVEHTSYDGEGNVRESIDAQGHVTRTDVAHFDLPIAETGPDGARLAFAYDTELRLVSVTNQQGLVWRYHYDAAGNLVRETDFNGRELRYAYDAAGQLIERTNAAGETITFTRDALGRIVQRRCGDAVTTFDYDEADRILRARNTDADVAFSYDALGRVLTETLNGRTVASGYDRLGRRTRRRTPSGAESIWEYNAINQPIALHTAGQTLRFDYDPAGREVRRRVGSHVTLTQAFDANDRLSSQTLLTPGGPSGQARVVQRRGYTYQPDGQLTEILDQLAGPRRFDLDAVGRVTAVHGPQWTERYAYDPAGNLTHAGWPTAGPGSPDSAAVGDRDYAGSLITRAGNTHYAHDAEGRITTRHLARQAAPPVSWRYSWDAENRLTAVVTPDGQRWRYAYDPFGRRIAKQRLHPDDSVAERVDFTWDGNHLIEQVHNGTKATVWEWEPNTHRVLTQTERQITPQTPQRWIDQRFYAIVTDLVGTPTEMVDPHGNLAWHTDTTLWGTLKTPPGNAYTPLRFPGQYHDHETGLYYNLHRYYDPTTGRYTTHDPLGLAPSPNPHTYVPNPTGWTDPLGLMDCRGSGNSGGRRGLDNPQLRPNPPMPQWMYRGDTRPSAELFQNGMTSWGKNYDLVSHVHGGNQAHDSGYVSVTPSARAAHQFVVPDGGAPIRHSDGKWYLPYSGQIYQIQPTGNMIHMASQNLPGDLKDRMQYQTEWDAVHHIDPQNIHSAMTVRGYFHQGADGERTSLPGRPPEVTEIRNPNFVDGHPGYDPHADPASGFTRETDLGLGGQ